MENLHISKSVSKENYSIPDIILNTNAFKLLKYNHRSLLYSKLNTYFKPQKTNSYYKQMFLYPYKWIPRNDNFKFYIVTMEHCLRETLNDVLIELKVKKAEIEELIPQIEKELK